MASQLLKLKVRWIWPKKIFPWFISFNDHVVSQMQLQLVVWKDLICTYKVRSTLLIIFFYLSRRLLRWCYFCEKYISPIAIMLYINVLCISSKQFPKLFLPSVSHDYIIPICWSSSKLQKAPNCSQLCINFSTKQHPILKLKVTII